MRRKRKKKTRRSKRTRGSVIGPVLLEMIGIIGLLLLVTSRDKFVENQSPTPVQDNAISLTELFAGHFER